jgi:hypothetical protein
MFPRKDSYSDHCENGESGIFHILFHAFSNIVTSITTEEGKQLHDWSEKWK